MTDGKKEEEQKLSEIEKEEKGCYYYLIARYFRYKINSFRTNLKEIEFLQKSVDHGNSHAMCCLANIYLEGEKDVLERDPKKALELYQQAVELNHYQATINLATIYLNGTYFLVKKNVFKAIELLEKAVKLKNHIAANFLSNIYENGEKGFVEIDVEKAAHYCFLYVEISKDLPSIFENFLKKYKVEWKMQYHVYWCTPNDLNDQIRTILLISKHKNLSTSDLVPNLIVKGIAIQIIKYLCHFKQFLNK